MIRLVLGIGFLVYPLAEIACFILVGRRIGLLATLGLVILGAVVGIAMMRHQGLGALSRARESARTGKAPGREVLDTAMIVVAGLLLLLPGFLSDIAGLLLFLPPVRTWLWNRLAASVVVVNANGGRQYQPADRPPTIDLDEDEFRRDRDS